VPRIPTSLLQICVRCGVFICQHWRSSPPAGVAASRALLDRYQPLPYHTCAGSCVIKRSGSATAYRRDKHARMNERPPPRPEPGSHGQRCTGCLEQAPQTIAGLCSQGQSSRSWVGASTCSGTEWTRTHHSEPSQDRPAVRAPRQRPQPLQPRAMTSISNSFVRAGHARDHARLAPAPSQFHPPPPPVTMLTFPPT